MPRSAAGRAAPSRAACARVASSARVGPLAGRTRTHAGVAVPRARVEVSRNFSRVRMGEGRLGAANRRLGAHSRRAQTQGRLSKMLCDATKYFDERPSPQITSRGSRRGRPMGWNSKVAKNNSSPHFLAPGGRPAAARARHGHQRQRQHLRRRARLRENVVDPREGRPKRGAPGPQMRRLKMSEAIERAVVAIVA